MSNFLEAARHTDRKRRMPHQDAAWQWAWTLLNKQQQDEFLEMFRADPPDKEVVSNSWSGIAEAAKRSGARYPALVAAQWALESGFGRYHSGRNNPFGIKGKGTNCKTQEFVSGKLIDVLDEFKDFGSLAEAVDELVAKWHKDYTSKSGKHYTGCNSCATIDEAARHLVKEGYATDPAYSQKLISLLRQHGADEDHFTPQSTYDHRISEHFTYGEFTLWKETRRFVHPYQCRVAQELAAYLETVREHFGGKPVVITSGHRPHPENQAAGGATDSEHLFSAPGVGAVDIYVDGEAIEAVQAWIDQSWPYSVGYGAARGFVHVGRRADGGRRRWDY